MSARSPIRIGDVVVTPAGDRGTVLYAGERGSGRTAIVNVPTRAAGAQVVEYRKAELVRV